MADRLEVEVVKAVRAAVPAAFIKEVLTRAVTLPEIAARLPEGGSTVAVRLASDRELRRLNRVYAGEDHATDVLSFAGAGDHLGDIAVSWPAVVRQSTQYGHPETTELALLSVHGLLHLLGWDHATREERREMSRLNVAALKPSGLKPAMRWVRSGYTPLQGLRHSPRA
ncbi:MAG: rRNA maturation RNase YbeY [Candidatus Dormiibacterota bacterium]